MPEWRHAHTLHFAWEGEQYKQRQTELIQLSSHMEMNIVGPDCVELRELDCFNYRCLINTG